MTYGFTPAQAYNLYRAVRKEIFPDWGIPPMRIQFSARPFKAHGWPPGHGGMASTLFDIEHPLKPAYAIVVDGELLPYMHEDELTGIIKHEIGHVIAGWDADHDEEWIYVARLLDVPPVPWTLLREWQSIPTEVLDFDEYWLEGINYQPTYGS